MKIVKIPAAVLRLLVAATTALAQTEDRGQTRHRFLGIDNGKNRLLCVDQYDAAKGWSANVPPGSRDLQLLDHGRVLVSHGNGAAEYDLATGRKLDWVVDRYSQISSAQRLASGHTLLGANMQAGVHDYSGFNLLGEPAGGSAKPDRGGGRHGRR